MNRYIEHTKLSPTMSHRDVDRLVAEAKEYHFLGVCVPPFWVKKAKRELKDTEIKLVTVVGFPLGYQMTECKLAEVEVAMNLGVDELDVVMNVSAFKSKMSWVKIELARLADCIHQQGKFMKVIIETAYLSNEEIVEACTLCSDAGSDFVKTSTGFAPAGAQVEDVRLMREVLPQTVGIKASGGIKCFAQLKALVDAGAERIGTSSGVDIMQEMLGEGSLI